MHEVHAGLDACLQDVRVPPLGRVRAFFEATQEKYQYRLKYGVGDIILCDTTGSLYRGRKERMNRLALLGNALNGSLEAAERSEHPLCVRLAQAQVREVRDAQRSALRPSVRGDIRIKFTGGRRGSGDP